MRLKARELACERGGRIVFESLSFELGAGELMQIAGPNGAGKTSLLRLIAGLGEPAAGALELEGRHDELTIGQHCHFVAHQEAIKPALTVRENLAFWGDFLGGGDIEAALASFELEALAAYAAQLLSAGQKRRLALSRLALLPRALWLLDEPTTGLDGDAQDRLAALMRIHLARGGLILAASHGPVGLEAQFTVTLQFAE